MISRHASRLGPLLATIFMQCWLLPAMVCLAQTPSCPSRRAAVRTRVPGWLILQQHAYLVAGVRATSAAVIPCMPFDLLGVNYISDAKDTGSMLTGKGTYTTCQKNCIKWLSSAYLGGALWAASPSCHSQSIPLCFPWCW